MHSRLHLDFRPFIENLGLLVKFCEFHEWTLPLYELTQIFCKYIFAVIEEKNQLNV